MKIKMLKRSLGQDQSGIASMVIVILIMTLLTLIVLSMTQNSNREQRQSLDRQMNTQAFYAAESGISDAKDYVVQNPTTAPVKKTECVGVSGAGPGQQFPGKSQTIISATDASITNVSYSCVLYNRIPKELKFANVSVGSSEIVPIEDAGGAGIQSLTFSWTREGGGSNFAGCPAPGDFSFPDRLADSCEAGMLRVELIDPTVANRDLLLSSAFVGFFKPANGPASSISFGSAAGTVNNQGAIVNGGCDANGCRVTINNISKNMLYLHLRSIYRSNKVSITGTTITGTEVQFRDAQMEVDSTGKVGDILKRIQVMVPLTSNKGPLPEFVLQTTGDICKQLQVRPGEVDDGC
ncbi:hypothetical protein HZB74_01285 [Candidatus Saccharibacteria bacterium]|nr:hypothetical protein [Candidatus Saccharibacteria bacterium]